MAASNCKNIYGPVSSIHICTDLLSFSDSSLLCVVDSSRTTNRSLSCNTLKQILLQHYPSDVSGAKCRASDISIRSNPSGCAQTSVQKQVRAPYSGFPLNVSKTAQDLIEQCLAQDSSATPSRPAPVQTKKKIKVNTNFLSGPDDKDYYVSRHTVDPCNVASKKSLTICDERVPSFSSQPKYSKKPESSPSSSRKSYATPAPIPVGTAGQRKSTITLLKPGSVPCTPSPVAVKPYRPSHGHSKPRPLSCHKHNWASQSKSTASSNKEESEHNAIYQAAQQTLSEALTSKLLQLISTEVNQVLSKETNCGCSCERPGSTTSLKKQSTISNVSSSHRLKKVPFTCPLPTIPPNPKEKEPPDSHLETDVKKYSTVSNVSSSHRLRKDPFTCPLPTISPNPKEKEPPDPHLETDVKKYSTVSNVSSKHRLKKVPFTSPLPSISPKSKKEEPSDTRLNTNVSIDTSESTCACYNKKKPPQRGEALVTKGHSTRVKNGKVKTPTGREYYKANSQTRAITSTSGTNTPGTLENSRHLIQREPQSNQNKKPRLQNSRTQCSSPPPKPPKDPKHAGEVETHDMKVSGAQSRTIIYKKRQDKYTNQPVEPLATCSICSMKRTPDQCDSRSKPKTKSPGSWKVKSSEKKASYHKYINQSSPSQASSSKCSRNITPERKNSCDHCYIKPPTCPGGCTLKKSDKEAWYEKYVDQSPSSQATSSKSSRNRTPEQKSCSQTKIKAPKCPREDTSSKCSRSRTPERKSSCNQCYIKPPKCVGCTLEKSDQEACYQKYVDQSPLHQALSSKCSIDGTPEQKTSRTQTKIKPPKRPKEDTSSKRSRSRTPERNNSCNQCYIKPPKCAGCTLEKSDEEAWYQKYVDQSPLHQALSSKCSIDRTPEQKSSRTQTKIKPPKRPKEDTSSKRSRSRTPDRNNSCNQCYIKPPKCAGCTLEKSDMEAWYQKYVDQSPLPQALSSKCSIDFTPEVKSSCTQTKIKSPKCPRDYTSSKCSRNGTPERKSSSTHHKIKLPKLPKGNNVKTLDKKASNQKYIDQSPLPQAKSSKSSGNRTPERRSSNTHNKINPPKRHDDKTSSEKHKHSSHPQATRPKSSRNRSPEQNSFSFYKIKPPDRVESCEKYHQSLLSQDTASRVLINRTPELHNSCIHCNSAKWPDEYESKTPDEGTSFQGFIHQSLPPQTTSFTSSRSTKPEQRNSYNHYKIKQPKWPGGCRVPDTQVSHAQSKQEVLMCRTPSGKCTDPSLLSLDIDSKNSKNKELESHNSNQFSMKSIDPFTACTSKPQTCLGGCKNCNFKTVDKEIPEPSSTLVCKRTLSEKYIIDSLQPPAIYREPYINKSSERLNSDLEYKTNLSTFEDITTESKSKASDMRIPEVPPRTDEKRTNQLLNPEALFPKTKIPERQTTLSSSKPYDIEWCKDKSADLNSVLERLREVARARSRSETHVKSGNQSRTEFCKENKICEPKYFPAQFISKHNVETPPCPGGCLDKMPERRSSCKQLEDKCKFKAPTCQGGCLDKMPERRTSSKHLGAKRSTDLNGKLTSNISRSRNSVVYCRDKQSGHDILRPKDHKESIEHKALSPNRPLGYPSKANLELTNEFTSRKSVYDNLQYNRELSSKLTHLECKKGPCPDPTLCKSQQPQDEKPESIFSPPGLGSRTPITKHLYPDPTLCKSQIPQDEKPELKQSEFESRVSITKEPFPDPTLCKSQNSQKEKSDLNYSPLEFGFKEPITKGTCPGPAVCKFPQQENKTPKQRYSSSEFKLTPSITKCCCPGPALCKSQQQQNKTLEQKYVPTEFGSRSLITKGEYLPTEFGSRPLITKGDCPCPTMCKIQPSQDRSPEHKYSPAEYKSRTPITKCPSPTMCKSQHTQDRSPEHKYSPAEYKSRTPITICPSPTTCKSQQLQDRSPEHKYSPTEYKSRTPITKCPSPTMCKSQHTQDRSPEHKYSPAEYKSRTPITICPSPTTCKSQQLHDRSPEHKYSSTEYKSRTPITKCPSPTMCKSQQSQNRSSEHKYSPTEYKSRTPITKCPSPAMCKSQRAPDCQPEPVVCSSTEFGPKPRSAKSVCQNPDKTEIETPPCRGVFTAKSTEHITSRRDFGASPIASKTCIDQTQNLPAANYKGTCNDCSQSSVVQCRNKPQTNPEPCTSCHDISWCWKRSESEYRKVDSPQFHGGRETRSPKRDCSLTQTKVRYSTADNSQTSSSQCRANSPNCKDASQQIMNRGCKKVNVCGPSRTALQAKGQHKGLSCKSQNQQATCPKRKTSCVDKASSASITMTLKLQHPVTNSTCSTSDINIKQIRFRSIGTEPDISAQSSLSSIVRAYIDYKRKQDSMTNKRSVGIGPKHSGQINIKKSKCRGLMCCSIGSARSKRSVGGGTKSGNAFSARPTSQQIGDNERSPDRSYINASKSFSGIPPSSCPCGSHASSKEQQHLGPKASKSSGWLKSDTRTRLAPSHNQPRSASKGCDCKSSGSKTCLVIFEQPKTGSLHPCFAYAVERRSDEQGCSCTVGKSSINASKGDTALKMSRADKIGYEYDIKFQQSPLRSSCSCSKLRPKVSTRSMCSGPEQSPGDAPNVFSVNTVKTEPSGFSICLYPSETVIKEATCCGKSKENEDYMQTESLEYADSNEGFLTKCWPFSSCLKPRSKSTRGVYSAKRGKGARSYASSRTQGSQSQTNTCQSQATYTGSCNNLNESKDLNKYVSICETLDKIDRPQVSKTTSMDSCENPLCPFHDFSTCISQATSMESVKCRRSPCCHFEDSQTSVNQTLPMAPCPNPSCPSVLEPKRRQTMSAISCPNPSCPNVLEEKRKQTMSLTTCPNPSCPNVSEINRKQNMSVKSYASPTYRYQNSQTNENLTGMSIKMYPNSRYPFQHSDLLDNSQTKSMNTQQNGNMPDKKSCPNSDCPFGSQLNKNQSTSDEQNCPNPCCPLKKSDTKNKQVPEKICDHPGCPFQGSQLNEPPLGPQSCPNSDCPFDDFDTKNNLTSKNVYDHPCCPFRGLQMNSEFTKNENSNKICLNSNFQYKTVSVQLSFDPYVTKNLAPKKTSQNFQSNNKQNTSGQSTCPNPCCPFDQNSQMPKTVCDHPCCPFQESNLNKNHGMSDQTSCPNPRCSFKNPVTESSQTPKKICDHPCCPFQESQLNENNPMSDQTSCPNPCCPFKTTVSGSPKTPNKICDHPCCPFQESQLNRNIALSDQSSCPNPRCLLKNPVIDSSKAPKEICDHPCCPFQESQLNKNNAMSDKSNCPNPSCPKTPVIENSKMPKNICDHPCCPFQESQLKKNNAKSDKPNNPNPSCPSKTPVTESSKMPKNICDHPCCPFQESPLKKNNAMSDKSNCPNPSCPSKTPVTENSNMPKNICDHPCCPFQESPLKKNNAMSDKSNCPNPSCPSKTPVTEKSKMPKNICDHPCCPFQESQLKKNNAKSDKSNCPNPSCPSKTPFTESSKMAKNICDHPCCPNQESQLSKNTSKSNKSSCPNPCCSSKNPVTESYQNPKKICDHPCCPFQESSLNQDYGMSEKTSWPNIFCSFKNSATEGYQMPKEINNQPCCPFREPRLTMNNDFMSSDQSNYPNPRCSFKKAFPENSHTPKRSYDDPCCPFEASMLKTNQMPSNQLTHPTGCCLLKKIQESRFKTNDTGTQNNPNLRCYFKSYTKNNNDTQLTEAKSMPSQNYSNPGCQFTTTQKNPFNNSYRVYSYTEVKQGQKLDKCTSPCRRVEVVLKCNGGSCGNASASRKVSLPVKRIPSDTLKKASGNVVETVPNTYAVRNFSEPCFPDSHANMHHHCCCRHIQQSNLKTTSDETDTEIESNRPPIRCPHSCCNFNARDTTEDGSLSDVSQEQQVDSQSSGRKKKSKPRKRAKKTKSTPNKELPMLRSLSQPHQYCRCAKSELNQAYRQSTSVLNLRVITPRYCSYCGQRSRTGPSGSQLDNIVRLKDNPNGEATIDICAEVELAPQDSEKLPCGPSQVKSPSSPQIRNRGVQFCVIPRGSSDTESYTDADAVPDTVTDSAPCTNTDVVPDTATNTVPKTITNTVPCANTNAVPKPVSNTVPRANNAVPVTVAKAIDIETNTDPCTITIVVSDTGKDTLSDDSSGLGVIQQQQATAPIQKKVRVKKRKPIPTQTGSPRGRVLAPSPGVVKPSKKCKPRTRSAQTKPMTLPCENVCKIVKHASSGSYFTSSTGSSASRVTAKPSSVAAKSSKQKSVTSVKKASQTQVEVPSVKPRKKPSKRKTAAPSAKGTQTPSTSAASSRSKINAWKPAKLAFSTSEIPCGNICRQKLSSSSAFSSVASSSSGTQQVVSVQPPCGNVCCQTRSCGTVDKAIRDMSDQEAKAAKEAEAAVRPCVCPLDKTPCISGLEVKAKSTKEKKAAPVAEVPTRPRTPVKLMNPKNYKGNTEGVISQEQYKINKKKKKKPKEVTTDVSIPVRETAALTKVKDKDYEKKFRFVECVKVTKKLKKGETVTCLCPPPPPPSQTDPKWNLLFNLGEFCSFCKPKAAPKPASPTTATEPRPSVCAVPCPCVISGVAPVTKKLKKGQTITCLCPPPPPPPQPDPKWNLLFNLSDICSFSKPKAAPKPASPTTAIEPRPSVCAVPCTCVISGVAPDPKVNERSSRYQSARAICATGKDSNHGIKVQIKKKKRSATRALFPRP